jgi:hypothetical protein
MDYTERVSEIMCPLLAEYPDSLGPGTQQSAWVDVSAYHRVWLMFMLGDMAQGAALDWVDLHMATSAAGADEQDINVIDADDVTTTDETYTTGNKILCIEMKTEELAYDRLHTYVSVVAEVTGAAMEFGYTLFGVSPRVAPVPQTAWTEVVD